MKEKPVVVGQVISATVEKIIYGGFGLVRYNDFVIFVREVLAGEQISIEVTQVKAHYAYAKVLKVDVASTHRIDANCPHFGECGGCQLQHIAPEFHEKIKREWLAEAFSFLPEQEISFVSSKQMWQWRRKITVHARLFEGKWRIGYWANDNITVVPVKRCPIFFYENESHFFKRLQEIIEFFPQDMGVDISFIRVDSGMAVLFKGKKAPIEESKKKIVHLCQRYGWIGIFNFPRWRFSMEKGEASFSSCGKQWSFSVQSFIQNHPGQSERVWQDVLSHVSGPRVVDAYSGVGVTAILLAEKGCEVEAIESSRGAVLAAKQTAQKYGISSVKMHCGNVEEVLPALAPKSDWLILNPPRAGLSKKAVQVSIKHEPKNIVYVSCSPATLARDVRHFVESGWAVHKICGYDLFPQTFHFETVVVLTK